MNNRIQDDFHIQREHFRICAMTEKLRFAASGFLFVAAVLASAALIFIFGALGLRGNSAVHFASPKTDVLHKAVNVVVGTL